MKLKYDRPGDILYLHHVAPTRAQVMREISEGIYVLVNGETGEIEGYEVHGLSARPGDFVELFLPATLEAPSRA